MYLREIVLNCIFSVKEVTGFLNEIKNQGLLMVPLVQTFGHMEVLKIKRLFSASISGAGCSYAV